MAINPSIGLVGVAVQEGRDTPASTPTFLHGLTGGTPFGASRSIANTPVACGNRGPSDARVDSIEINPSVQTLCFPDVIGLYLYAALGEVTSAADTVAGEGYYKHVFKMGSALPYLTVWSQVGVDNFTRSDGCKVSQLQFSATGNEHLAAQVDMMGIDAQVGIDAIPGSLDPSCYEGKYTTTDCTFKLDTASETPADALVADATFTISNGVSGLTSLGRVTPRDIADGNLSAGVSVTTIPDDITQYQKMMTGSASSTQITGKVVLGSVYAKFKSSDDEKMTLEFQYDHVPFTADYVSVEPEGAEGTIQFTSDAAIIAAADESPVTITLVNKTPSYKA
jgi:hypothetical protein